MPVVRISLPRFAKMVGAKRETILDRIPYVGLDIEGLEGDELRVEYSPNRPDFGTDYGIARALRGILGKEVGLPAFPTAPSGITVTVDPRLAPVRPYIACALATGLSLDDEDVRQLISLQEDLHNGLGRRRRRVAIGLHDMDAVRPPLSYSAVEDSFSFVPLGSRKKASVREILVKTPEGKSYGPSLGKGPFPIIKDAAGTVLSFPPVINGDATRVTAKTKWMFIDVTSTDEAAGDDVLAVLTTTLAEAGGKIGTVKISQKRPKVTPDLSLVKVKLDQKIVRGLVGLDLTPSQVKASLARSRLDVKGTNALAPRYRVDLMHPVDLAEEVALGYGFDKIGPLYPPSSTPGRFDDFEEFLDRSSTIMAGSGMIEFMTYELSDEATLYTKFGRKTEGMISVLDPKSREHSVLRDSVLSTLMGSLSSNAKSDYPQRVFEVGRVYQRSGGVKESWHLGCLIAHAGATFSEAKMHMEAYCRTTLGVEPVSASSEHWAFAKGRSATVSAGGVRLGWVGEVKPEALEAFVVNVPVSGFELDLSSFYKLLK